MVRAYRFYFPAGQTGLRGRGSKFWLTAEAKAGRQPGMSYGGAAETPVGASCFSRGKERFSAPEKKQPQNQCALALGTNSGDFAARVTTQCHRKFRCPASDGSKWCISTNKTETEAGESLFQR
jgi:hypothetical protein